MAFWRKKSEDPWDVDPTRKREPVSFFEQEQAGEEQGVLESVKEQWAQRRQEQQEALTLPQEACPWCGKNMEQGFMTGDRGVYWMRGVPDTKVKWFGAGDENTMRVDVEGLFYTYKTTWYCPDCQKMILDAADLQTRAEEYPASDSQDSFARWDGNLVAPYTSEKREKEE